MALQVQNYKRVFKHGNIELSDPNPDMTPEEVMGFYSNQYPELTTSNVHGRRSKRTRLSMSSRPP